MYVRLEEAAEYLELPIEKVRQLILQGKIRAHHDGEDYLINKGQFDQYFKDMDRLREQLQAYLNEPVPDSSFVKDED